MTDEPLQRLSNVFFKQFAKMNNKENSTQSGQNAIVKLTPWVYNEIKIITVFVFILSLLPKNDLVLIS